MIYFDIDGTVRNLHATFPPELQSFRKWEDFGSCHYEFVKQNLCRCLYDAPVYQDMFDFITCQENTPIFLTSNTASYFWNYMFLFRHFRDFELIVVESMEAKLKYLVDGVLLFDDYPYFPEEYRDRIVLVEREWNREYKGNYNKVFRGRND